MKIKLLLLLFSLLLLSCNKEDNNSNVLMGEYELPTQMHVDDVQMYTSAGKITNTQIIRDFLKTRPNTPFSDYVDYSTYFYLNESLVPFALSGNDHFSATFNGETATVNARLFGVTTYDKNIDFEIDRYDPLVILTASVGSKEWPKPESIEGYYSDNTSISKIELFIAELGPIDPIEGFSSFKMRMNVPLIFRDAQIAIPVLISLQWHNSEYGVFCRCRYHDWNFLNEACLDHLHTGDTVVVQTGKFILRKK